MYEKTPSEEHQNYLKQIKCDRIKIVCWQAGLLLFFILLWQVAADKKWINDFITSSPSKIAQTISSLAAQGQLFRHLFITLAESTAGFILGMFFGTAISVLLWWFPTTAKVADPYLVVLNALPKVALGPVIIIWAGAGVESIIIMTLAISLITTIIGIYGGLKAVESEKLMLMQTFGANKKQILFKVLLPASYANILSVLKINVGLSWVGVIIGEFLVSKAGLGYLIMYGSQVFNLNLVMTGVIVLALCAAGMYLLISRFEKIVLRRFGE